MPRLGQEPVHLPKAGQIRPSQWAKGGEYRNHSPDSGLAVLDQLSGLVELVDQDLYGNYERLARERIEIRDPDDWPVVAVALLLDLPIWTEDQDLFGTGVATWTTGRVEIFLKAG